MGTGGYKRERKQKPGANRSKLSTSPELNGQWEGDITVTEERISHRAAT